MAKSKKAKKNVSKICEEDNERLPQNIISIGERVEENKNIYISQSVYKEIHNFTKDKKVNEAGGMLIGNIIEEFGKTNIIINGFVEAKHCEATPTTLTFTHETWDACHKEIDKKFPNKKIVGWIHTHPNYGIFLSEYDKFIQENFFSEDYETAYVVDPIQDIEGFYFWINGRIERCKGFYIYDKTGKKIETSYNKSEESSAEAETKTSEKHNLITIILCVVVAILTIALAVIGNKLNKLQNDFDTLVNGYNQNMSYKVSTIQSITESTKNDNQNIIENSTGVSETEQETTTLLSPETNTQTTLYGGEQNE